MYNIRYLPESFKRCGLEKTILRHFPYNLNLRSSWNAPIQDGGQWVYSLIMCSYLACIFNEEHVRTNTYSVI